MEYLVDSYLRELGRTRDTKTVRNKTFLLSHLLSFSEELEDFDRRRIKEFVSYLKEKGLKKSSIRQVLGETKRFYEWLEEKGYSVFFDQKTCKKLLTELPLSSEGRKRKRLTDEEVKLILRAIRGEIEGISAKHPIYYLLTTFLVSSGLRISEALKTQKKNVRIRKILTESGEEKEIWFVNVREGKFGKEREAPIFFWELSWKKMWEEWFRRLQPDDFIFTYNIKYPKSTKTFVLRESTVQRFYWDLERELKGKGYEIEINAHRFRYTYISKLGTIGIPVSIVARWVGHEKPTTTMNVYMEAEEEKQLSLIAERFL